MDPPQVYKLRQTEWGKELIKPPNARKQALSLWRLLQDTCSLFLARKILGCYSIFPGNSSDNNLQLVIKGRTGM